MKTLLAIVALLAFALVAFRPAVAAAEEMECPGHGMTTIQSLAMCVQHAASMGAISDPGVTNSLLAKINAAQIGVDSGQFGAAANILQALVNEVRAQSGIRIESGHAQHLIAHAQRVIAALP